MLKPIKVRIQNYQSIDDLEFEINGFTCITGKSNIGKSAIVRAISSALLNNPVIGMVRKGAPHSTVEIRTDEWEIKWEKGEKGINRYTVGGKIYDKVGAKQLDKIVDLGFKSVRVGSDEVYPWLASQFFPIFLLDRSGTQVTDFICEVSRLNVLQDAIVLSNRGKRKSTDDANKLEIEAKGLRSHQAKIASHKDIQSLQNDLIEQEKSIKHYELQLETIVKLRSVIDASAKSIVQLSTVNGVNVPKDDVDDLVSNYHKANSAFSALTHNAKRVIDLRSAASLKIPDLVTGVTELTDAMKWEWITEAQEKLEQLQRINFVVIPSSFDFEVSLLSKMVGLNGRINSITQSIKVAPSVPDAFDSEVNDLVNAQQIYAKLIEIVSDYKGLSAKSLEHADQIRTIDDDLSQIPLCPTCNRPGTAEEHQD
jgi:hypothetical protein